MRAIAQLRWWQARNRLHKLLHSPGWILFYLAIAAAFVLLAIYSARPAPSQGAIGVQTLGKLPLTLPHVLSLWALVATGMAIQQGTKRPPVTFSSADEAILLPSPLSPRQVFTAELAQHALGHLLRALLNMVWAGFILMSLSHRLPWGSLAGLAASFFLIELWADGIASAVWMALHRRPERQAAVAGAIRNLLLGATVALLAWMISPLLPSSSGGDRAASRPERSAVAVERLVRVAETPPFAWFGQLVSLEGFKQAVMPPPRASQPEAAPLPTESPSPATNEPVSGRPPAWPWPLALLALVGLTAGINGLAIGLAADYYEPALAATELQRQLMATARSSAGRPAQDSQGTALAALGRQVDHRLVGIRIPLFGKGAWAMAWAQLVRYLRFERATILYTILFVGLFGGVLGIVVRGAGLSPLLAWALPLFLSLLNLSTGYLGEEFRRPQIYLIPDPTIVRLFAASLVSWWDSAFTGSLMLWLAILVATVGTPALGVILLGTLAAWVLLLALTWLTLGTGLISTILVPPWLPPMTRFLLTLLLLLPALVGPAAALIAVAYYSASLPLAFLVAAAVAALVAVGLYALASRLFDRLEAAG